MLQKSFSLKKNQTYYLIRQSFVRSNHTHEYKWTNFRIPRQRLDTENMQEKVAPTGIGRGYFKCIFIWPKTMELIEIILFDKR